MSSYLYFPPQLNLFYLLLSMIVYHGCKEEYSGEVYCPYVIAQLKKGKSLAEAISLAENLYSEFADDVDSFMFDMAIESAQKTSLKSPFISTTKSRQTARSFALSNDTKGYIYTIEGPNEHFFDFNAKRAERGLPYHKTFGWMNELGIPIHLEYPFEIIMIQEISELKEVSTIIFEK